MVTGTLNLIPAPDDAATMQLHRPSHRDHTHPFQKRSSTFRVRRTNLPSLTQSGRSGRSRCSTTSRHRRWEPPNSRRLRHGYSGCRGSSSRCDPLDCSCSRSLAENARTHVRFKKSTRATHDVCRTPRRRRCVARGERGDEKGLKNFEAHFLGLAAIAAHVSILSAVVASASSTTTAATCVTTATATSRLRTVTGDMARLTTLQNEKRGTAEGMGRERADSYQQASTGGQARSDKEG
jgi:hypothetical protein